MLGWCAQICGYGGDEKGQWEREVRAAGDILLVPRQERGHEGMKVATI